ncbi:MAG: hypothetical protein FJZ43_02340 [Candidatus Staskawiczbacteria bacterium]|nr:hypothetical protein [Candidatus Staskawiczbacteria bacterium]
MENNRGVIKYFIIIAVILSVLFLSQQEFVKPFGKSFYSWSKNETNKYWSKSTNWLGASFYPKLSKEVESRGEPLKNEVITQKDNAVKNIWEKVKNYFAENFSNLTGTKVE